MVLKLLLITVLMSVSASADLVLGVGAGKGILNVAGTPFERLAVVGYQRSLGYDFFIRPEAGYFEDLSGGDHKSSLWIDPMFGIRAKTISGPELHLGVGPGWIKNPDALLGGHFQFALEGGGGAYSSDNKVFLGLVWRHLSSAGIEMPNQGRDFLMVEGRFAFF